jgi:TorA maturation chaperone TorD
LRQWGVSTAAAIREPPDHLSIELALLARLIRHGTGYQPQATLLDDHLMVWAPIFADRCQECDRTGFFAGAAEVLMAFLTAQRATLGIKRNKRTQMGVTLCLSD